MTILLALISTGHNNTVRQFCRVCGQGSYNGMYQRTQVSCDTMLPCSRARQKGHALHTPSRDHISPLIHKDKLYEVELPNTARQREVRHIAVRRPC